MGQGEEVRIVAKLDTTDITNGVDRAEGAARRMKQVWEQSTALGFPGTGGGGAGGSGGAGGGSSSVSAAGAAAGQSYLDGFLSRFLLRDAIMTALRGLSDIFAQVGKDLGELTGTNLNFSFKGFMDKIGDSIAQVLQQIKSIRDAVISNSERNIQKIQFSEDQRIQMDRYKKDPLTFNRSSADVEKQIEVVQEQEAKAEINNQKLKILQANAAADPSQMTFLQSMTGNLPEGQGANITDEALKNIKKDNAERLKQLNEELAIAKRKEEIQKTDATGWAEFVDRADREDKAEDKRQAAAADRAAKKEAADKKRAAAAAERKKKNNEEHADAQTILSDEAAERSGNKDLSFTRGQLDHQRATSAVAINGGLFGRNDSAATLVQHAATQINLLREISNELKATRKEKSDLTLL